MATQNELKSLVKLLKTDLLLFRDGNKTAFNPDFSVNPLTQLDLQENLRNLDRSSVQTSCPRIFQDNFRICYVYFSHEEAEYFLGPLSLVNFPDSSLPTYLGYYGLAARPFPLKTFNFDDILEVASLAAGLVTGKFWKHDELMAGNPHLSVQEKARADQWADHIRMEEVAEAHHTYQEERHLLEYVRRGAVEEALAYQNALDKSIGRLSSREVTHWRNLAIVAITLSTRAAIEGGLTPALAYKISDSYIQQCDSRQTAAQLITVRNKAVQELAENVRRNQKIQTQSSYIKASMTYIDRHYREKIYLEEVADFIGLSSTYFSKFFKKEVGMTFQHYIIQVRLEYAANLLRYSNESISVISEYVNFPSQSYFGRYFKNYYRMTPKDYRDLYHITD